VNDGYRLTPRAQQGLLGIVLYVEGRFGAQVTERVLESIEAALERLAANPGIGHRREDLTLNESVRFWSVGPTLIAYRSEHSPIEVLFIERGEVDWERLLGEHGE
jgi:plasmid stabilization system protein ParE